ncbi:uncharacterized protein LOC123505911 [Portunus trituberculatus]|uniref:uncharacterized protein LOC123505911 n=1 Tax=Portunus trituberculatus TaxID=210409 RepID=UPI001E1CC1AC|nr:uncharacterized protein LOC123505911 [Portunus trituberculatus]
MLTGHSYSLRSGRPVSPCSALEIKEEWRRLRAGNRSVCWDGDNGAGGGLASGTGGGLGYGKACLWTPFGGPQCLGVCGAGRFGVRGEELLHRRPPWSLRRWDFYRSSRDSAFLWGNVSAFYPMKHGGSEKKNTIMGLCKRYHRMKPQSPPFLLACFVFVKWNGDHCQNQMEKSHSSSVTGGVTSTSVQEEEGMGAIAEREHM